MKPWSCSTAMAAPQRLALAAPPARTMAAAAAIATRGAVAGATGSSGAAPTGPRRRRRAPTGPRRERLDQSMLPPVLMPAPPTGSDASPESIATGPPVARDTAAAGPAAPAPAQHDAAIDLLMKAKAAAERKQRQQRRQLFPSGESEGGEEKPRQRRAAGDAHQPQRQQQQQRPRSLGGAQVVASPGMNRQGLSAQLASIMFRSETGRLAIPDPAAAETALHALQFASSMLSRDRGSVSESPAVIALRAAPLTDAGWSKRSMPRPGAAAAAKEDQSGSAAEEIESVAAAVAAGEKADGGSSSGNASAQGMLLLLSRAPVETARRAANSAPLFSVRAGDDPSVRGKALAEALLGGIKSGRLGLLIKCWGRTAMPVAAQALLIAREAMLKEGHELLAICDVRSEPANGNNSNNNSREGSPVPQNDAGSDDTSSVTSSGSSSSTGGVWRWRFLALSCPAVPAAAAGEPAGGKRGGGRGAAGAVPQPYLFSGGPAAAAASADA